MKNNLEIIGIILGVVLIAALIGAIEAAVFMLLWNCVVCAIFTSVPTLSFWLAWGALLLINIIGSAFKTTVNVRK
jgi:hypothetical protein